jgi:predicted CXXCH cytochrome family protein
LPRGAPLEVERIRFEPAGHVKALRLDEVGNLSIDADGTALTAHLPESCPVSISSSPPVLAIPLMRLAGDFSQVGFDTTFELTAALGCKEGERGHVEWRQIEGPSLAETSVLDGGRKFRARTLPRSRFLPDPLPPGIVAVSPRTQGRYVIEASLSFDDRPTVRRSATVTSIARATGLSSLAVSQRVMLGGSGWHVDHAPRGGRAQVENGGGAATFAPDVAGRWVLADGAGNRMGVQSLTHDRTPLDCGRAECHSAIAAAATSTPMSEALARPLRSGSAPGCTLECHVVGERGLRDGGFFDVMETLGFRSRRSAVFDQLPHALQRLGGVRCTSCHGPGAIPEPGDRPRILRASVCATCHDAPPAYTHVADWARSGMARADRVVETRAAPCARCHTTGGFLDAIGVRHRPDASRDPDGAIVGISCAACHAPHGAHGAALVRTSTTGSVCIGCHTPAPDETVPSASSAVLVAGRLRFPAALGGTEESGPAPHAALPNGCTGCHGASPGKRAGTDHSFRVDQAVCASCHASGVPTEDRTLHDRATQLMARLRGACSAAGVAETPHAHPPSCKLPPVRARALYAATLVSEDSGAAVHNGPFARKVLVEAEAALDQAASPPTSR